MRIFNSLTVYFSPDKNLIFSLKNILGFTPGNMAVYKLALLHRSVAKDTAGGIKLSNERLEYLGDAILGAVVADLLFRKFPYRDEGFLTEMRSRIVSRENLKNVALKIGLKTLIQNTAEAGTFRSMYGDAFEALLGAVYLDKGYKTAENFIVTRIIKIHVDLHELEITDNNFKSKIINWGQKEKQNVVFEMVEENNETKLFRIRVTVNGKEMGEGEDYSKKKAEQIAAGKACGQLGI